jgi:ribosomal protein S12 methylthiotransferase
MKSKTFILISLGCAKNTVDSESMAELLGVSGYHAVEKPSKADIIIVNTCGFIQAARDESLQTLRDLAKKKKSGQKLIAAGCLTDRYRQQLTQEIDGIDGILSTRRWMDIVDLTSSLEENRPAGGVLYNLPENEPIGSDERGASRTSIQGSSAYLKIADGCRRPCAFCSIPLIKGTTVSRSPENILAEAKALQQKGIQELILIAQDTTDYGHDLGIKDGLAYLLENIIQSAPEIPWLRVLYAYPGYVTDRLIEIMATSPQIVHYLDMPLQHAHPDMLRRMRRPADMDWVRKTLSKMRTAIPNLALRTTFIVGYPGETEAEFQTLLDFMSEIQFDHVGAFTFSFEPGTSSEPLGDPILFSLKNERLERLMLLQQEISLKRNQSFIGKNLDILVEGQDNGISIGRSYRDAPEIDGMVLIEDVLPVGQIVPVRITGALIHDLTAKAIPSPQ